MCQSTDWKIEDIEESSLRSVLNNLIKNREVLIKYFLGTFIETTDRISTPSIQEPAVQRKEAFQLEEEPVERTRQESILLSEVQQEVQQIVEEVSTAEAPQMKPPEGISVLKEIQEEDILRSAVGRVKKGKKEQEKRVPEVVMKKVIE